MMKKNYLIAVTALIGLAVVSTYALGVLTDDMTETLTTDTTLDYDVASASFVSSDTNRVSDDSFTVLFEVYQESAQAIKLTVTACDTSGDPIIIDLPATYSYYIDYDTATDDEATGQTFSGSTLTFTVTT
ncbi:unnamed protein product, partial [marine sediment metagenome]